MCLHDSVRIIIAHKFLYTYIGEYKIIIFFIHFFKLRNFNLFDLYVYT